MKTKAKPKKADRNGVPAKAVAHSPLDVLTLAQAAAYLQVAEESVRLEAESGRIAGRLIGKEWRFLKATIADWLKAPRPRIGQFEFNTDETPEEHEAFLANIRNYRDEIDRATGSGKYALE